MRTKPRQMKRPMPPRKPLDQHKQSMTVSIDPSNRKWIRDSFRDNGYRSESHLVDGAISLLKDKLKGDEARSPIERKRT